MVKFACCAALLPCALWTAHAQTVLFGNLSATASAYETVNTDTPVIGNSGPLFDSFSTGPSPLILSDGSRLSSPVQPLGVSRWSFTRRPWATFRGHNS